MTASCTASFNANGSNWLSVLGTEGRIVTEPIFGVDADHEIEVIRAGGGASVTVDEPHEVIEEFDLFAAHVANDRSIGPDGHHGVVDLEIAEAVYESDERGTTVDL